VRNSQGWGSDSNPGTKILSGFRSTSAIGDCSREGFRGPFIRLDRWRPISPVCVLACCGNKEKQDHCRHLERIVAESACDSGVAMSAQ
jgi:hypothetical protein